jgi:predicted PurR-regulated permease PerM
MWLLAQRTAVILGTICVFLGTGALLYGMLNVLVLFLFAIFFAYLLEPWVARVQGWTRVSHNSRSIAILEVYVLLGAGGAILLFLFGPKITSEGRTLAASLPGLLEKVRSGQIARQIGANRGWSYGTQVRLEQLLSQHRSTVLSLEADFAAGVAAFVQNAIWLVIIPILSIFFLRDGSRFVSELVAFADRGRQRQFLRGILQDVHSMLAHFIRAQILLAVLALGVYMAGLWILRVPYPLALGSMAGVMEFVPVVGPFIAAAAILSVAFLANYPHLLVVALFLGAWRVTQDYFISPRVMGERLEVHPLAAIFAVLAGAEIAGVLGVYLSVPLLATLRILWRRWQLYSHVQSQPPSARPPASNAA